jgi:large subunit ribosomal protein L19
MQSVITPVRTEERAKLGIKPGDTVRVYQKIVELKRGRAANKKEVTTKNSRTQVFEGLVLAVKHGTEAGATFTVRATLSGIGVEKIFPLYAPFIEKIEIVRRSKVRRAKLYFIREKVAREVRRQLRNMRMANISTEDFAEEEVPEVADDAVIDAEVTTVEPTEVMNEADESVDETPIVEETIPEAPAEESPSEEPAEEPEAAEETPAE